MTKTWKIDEGCDFNMTETSPYNPYMRCFYVALFLDEWGMLPPVGGGNCT